MSYRYEILGHVGPLGKNLNFSASFVTAEVLAFSVLPPYTEVVLLKTFLQQFELCFYCKY